MPNAWMGSIDIFIKSSPSENPLEAESQRFLNLNRQNTNYKTNQLYHIIVGRGILAAEKYYYFFTKARR